MSFSICISFEGDLWAPEHEPHSHHIGLVVVDAVNSNDLFTFLQLECPRFALSESAFNLEEWLHVFVVHAYSLHVF